MNDELSTAPHRVSNTTATIVMPHVLKRAPVLALVSLLALTGCSEETDADLRTDAGADTAESPATDEEMPSVDTIDTDGVDPARTRRIRVESARKAGVISESPPLSARSFLESEQAESLLETEALTTSTIPGQSSSEHHNSIRYRPEETADDEQFGLGLQIWDLESSDQSATDRLDELRDQFLGVRSLQADGLPEGTFGAERAGIWHLVFAGESGRHVFVLSCGDRHCEGIDELTELGADIAADH